MTDDDQAQADPTEAGDLVSRFYVFHDGTLFSALSTSGRPPTLDHLSPPVGLGFTFMVTRGAGGVDFYGLTGSSARPAESPYVTDILPSGVLTVAMRTDGALINAYAPGGWLRLQMDLHDWSESGNPSEGVA